MYKRVAQQIALPVSTHHFLRSDVGQEYGLTLVRKLSLLRSVKRNVRCITSATGWSEHLLLASHLLSLPKSLDGVVVECGCFKGSSTASLSLICEAVGRRLIVCDSFSGLPEVQEDDRVHVTLDRGVHEVYKKGDYTGALDEVKANVREYGVIDACEFVEGYFEDTLPQLRERVAFVFLDVDLHSSLKTCLLHLWPLLQERGYLFTHEAQQLPFAAHFFDNGWWRQHLAADAPGLVGAGCGLPTGIAQGSGLGYTRKPPAQGDETAYTSEFCGDPTQRGRGLSPDGREQP